MVEIAIRALSPAVNDTFTAITCIDWLSDGLCRVSAAGAPRRIHRDHQGRVRVVAAELRYSRLVERAFDKIRQAGRGMPAVGIRQLENLAKVAEYATTDAQRRIISRQAAMIMRSANDAIAAAEFSPLLFTPSGSSFRHSVVPGPKHSKRCISLKFLKDRHGPYYR